MRLSAVVAVVLFVAVASGRVWPAAAAQSPSTSPLKLEVYTSDDRGYATTSTIVYGASQAVLLDPQFLASDARKVAAINTRERVAFSCRSGWEHQNGVVQHLCRDRSGSRR